MRLLLPDLSTHKTFFFSSFPTLGYRSLIHRIIGCFCWKAPQEVPCQPPVQSRVSYEVRPVCLELHRSNMPGDILRNIPCSSEMYLHWILSLYRGFTDNNFLFLCLSCSASELSRNPHGSSDQKGCLYLAQRARRVVCF